MRHLFITAVAACIMLPTVVHTGNVSRVLGAVGFTVKKDGLHGFMDPNALVVLIYFMLTSSGREARKVKAQ